MHNKALYNLRTNNRINENSGLSSKQASTIYNSIMDWFQELGYERYNNAYAQGDVDVLDELEGKASLMRNFDFGDEVLNQYWSDRINNKMQDNRPTNLLRGIAKTAGISISDQDYEAMEFGDILFMEQTDEDDWDDEDEDYYESKKKRTTMKRNRRMNEDLTVTDEVYVISDEETGEILSDLFADKETAIEAAEDIADEQGIEVLVESLVRKSQYLRHK